jgi:UDP-glucose 4-epimerase
MVVLITGGAGFIGSKLAEELIKRGKIVRILDNLSSGDLSNINHLIKTGAVEFIKGDIRDKDIIKKSSNDCDLIYHLAAQSSVPFSMENPDIDMEVNIKGTLNVLMIAKEIGAKVVFTSSSTVYGIAKKIPTHEDVELNPYSFYGLSKMTAEYYCKLYSQHFNLPTVILRLYNVYGPRNNKGLIFDIYRKLMINPRRLEILGSGMQTKDYVYIDDVVEALLSAPELSKCKGDAYNIASGESYSVLDIAKFMIEILNLKDVEIVIKGGKSWIGDVEFTKPDVSKAERELGWKAKTEIKEGLLKTIKWLEEKLGRIPNL